MYVYAYACLYICVTDIHSVEVFTCDRWQGEERREKRGEGRGGENRRGEENRGEERRGEKRGEVFTCDRWQAIPTTATYFIKIININNAII